MIVIAMTIGEFIFSLCKQKGLNKCIRLIAGVLTVFFMILKALSAQ